MGPPRDNIAYRMGSVWPGYIACLLFLGLAWALAFPEIWMPPNTLAEFDDIRPYHLVAAGLLALTGLWAGLQRRVMIFGRDGSFTIQKWLFLWPRHQRWESHEIWGLVHTPRRDTGTGNLNQVRHRISLLLESGDMITLLDGLGDGFWNRVRKLEKATGRKAQRRIAPGI